MYLISYNYVHIDTAVYLYLISVATWVAYSNDLYLYKYVAVTLSKEGVGDEGRGQL